MLIQVLLITSISTYQTWCAQGFSFEIKTINAIPTQNQIWSANTLHHAMKRGAKKTHHLEAVRGGGWGNDDFLNSLSGDEEERQNETQNYSKYKETKEAFNKRQQERMDTPAGRQFMQQQKELKEKELRNREERNRNDLDGTGSFFEDMGVGMGMDENMMNGGDASGSARFRHMMNQASSRMEGQRGVGDGQPSFGFEQKFAIPLDDDDEEDN